MREDDFSKLELRPSSCLYNYRYFRSRLLPQTRVLVLVKANAYGHGAVEFAAMMQQAGADYLAVAYPVEGIELRRGGISLPVMVLTAGVDHFNDIIDYRLEPEIPSLYALQILCGLLKARGVKDYPIHIKIDSGMHRLGYMPAEIPSLVAYLKDCPYVKVKSCFSHLAAAEDPAEDEFTLGQIRSFRQNAGVLAEGIGYRPMFHILNSAGIERFPQYQFDMVRLGIGIYGISALPDVRLQPVATLKCKIIQIKELPSPEDTIGYGRRGHVASGGTTVATIPVGYADGIDRHLGNGRASFSLNGRRVPTIGNICMDMCMLDVTGISAKAGDTVTVFGDDPTVSELASLLDTIPYEVFCSIPRRIPRVIVRE